MTGATLVEFFQRDNAESDELRTHNGSESSRVGSRAAHGCSWAIGVAPLGGSQRRKAGVRPVDHPVVDADVPALVRDTLVADCRARATG